MVKFRDFLRGSKLYSRMFTYGMILLCWDISIHLGQWFGCENSTRLLVIGVIGIWIGVAIAYQLHTKWIFPKENKSKEGRSQNL